MKSSTCGLLFLFSVILYPIKSQAIEGYYSHPAVYGDRLVFQSEGDLWLAPLQGGTAERLTTHTEIESQPAFSRDGERIAFMAGYDGGREVYVMPVAGGKPKRISFEDEPVSVEGWTSEGEVLITTSAVIGPRKHTAIRAIDPGTLARHDWPLLNANEAAIGALGDHYFTRFGQRFDHSKAYRGGTMAQLWRYQAGAEEAERLLGDLEANAQRPLWAAGRLYFLSDADGTWNLWSVDQAGSDLRQHTTHDVFAVRNADTDGETIVYQHGADLWRFDPVTRASERIPLEIRSDLDHTRQRFIDELLEYVESVTFAPAGDRLAITARGQLVLAGLPTSRRITIPVSRDLRARQARVSPDGDTVYALVADGQQDEIVRYAADGSGTVTPVTRGGDARRERMVLSPDGALLAHNDFRGRLWLTDTDTRASSVVSVYPAGGDSHLEFAFSPDSKLLAFTESPAPSERAKLYLYEIASGRTMQVASARFSAYSPAFSPDGRWLYFLSDRNFSPNPGSPWGDRNLGPVFDARGMILALDLTAHGRFPFLPEVLGGPAAPAEEEDDMESDTEGDTDKVEQAVKVTWDGLDTRLYQVPVAPGNFSRLRVTSDHLFVLRDPWGGEKELLSIAIGDSPEAEAFAGEVEDYDLSLDGKRLYFRVEDKLHIVDAGAKAPEGLSGATVSLGNWRLALSPQDEWEQMFHDAWRMHRDFSFDPGMRGLDWDAVRDRYAPLLPRVKHREELEDLLGEMIAELDILHSAVRGAELPEDEGSAVAATLAAEFRSVTHGLEITRIYSGDPDLLEERSPLGKPEVGARIGDVIVSVNHSPIRDRGELAAALADQSEQPVLLEIKRPGETLREVVVQPVAGKELPRMRYRYWEQEMRARVKSASEGRIGYLHLHAMGSRDIADFAREFYSQNDRGGLVIDVRSNRGGNIDSWVIGELARSAWAFWQMPYADEYYGNRNMQGAFRGHIVVLIDAFTYSDGETFAAGIKALDLAPLIGTRTAGAGIWLTGRNRLIDGGVARIAELAQFDLDGNWIVEGYGVEPDIEVDNLPRASWEGGDAQLERALEILEERIREAPVPTLRGEPIPPVGVPARDVRRGSAVNR